MARTITVDLIEVTVVDEGEVAPGDETGFVSFSSRTVRYSKPDGMTVQEAIAQLTPLLPELESPLNEEGVHKHEEAILAVIDEGLATCACQSTRHEKHDVNPPCHRRQLARKIIEAIQ